MKYIFILSLFIIKSFSNSINVGTVLFSEADTLRKCWSAEQLALLRARYVYQDILPKCSALTMCDDSFVTGLVTYFRMAMEKVKTLTNGKTKQINMQAIADTIGGYLHHIVFPVAKDAFYWGKICFDSVDQIRNLLNEIKTYLRTNGQTWSPPIAIPKRVKKDLHGMLAIRPTRYKEGFSCEGLLFRTSSSCNFEIPMPFLDSKTNPSSIALPFKNFPLRNLKASNCGNLLWEYYYSVMNCMCERNVDQDGKRKFMEQYSIFLDQEVIPHLNDEDLYACFGGVYKLRETLHNNGQIPGKSDASGPGAYLTNLEEKSVGTGVQDEDFYSDEKKSTTVIFIAVAVVILIWIITGILFCCCRNRRRKESECWKQPPTPQSPHSLKPPPPPTYQTQPTYQTAPPIYFDSATETAKTPTRTTATRTNKPKTTDHSVSPAHSPVVSPTLLPSSSPMKQLSAAPSPPKQLSVAPSPPRLTSIAEPEPLRVDPGPQIKKTWFGITKKKADCAGPRDLHDHQPCNKCQKKNCIREEAVEYMFQSKSDKRIFGTESTDPEYNFADVSLKKCAPKEQSVVFGYDFDTSNSETTSSTTSSSEYTPRTVI